MFTLIVWSLILFFVPDSVRDLISAKIGIPYALQICSFAVAYLVGLLLKGVGQFFMRALPLYHRSAMTKRMLKTLNSLSTEQLFLLDSFLKTRSSTFWATRDNPDADALVKAGIVRPVGSGIDGVSVMFKIEPEYESLMLSTWNPHSKRFDNRL